MQMHSPRLQDHAKLKDRISVEELLAERRLSIARMRRLKNSALESKALKDLQEARLLQQLADPNQDLASLEPQMAMNIARVSRDALLAAERYEITRLREAEEVIKAIQDSVELARARVAEADNQIGRLMVIFDKLKVPIAPLPNLIPGLPDPLPLSTPLPQLQLLHSARLGKVLERGDVTECDEERDSSEDDGCVDDDVCAI